MVPPAVVHHFNGEKWTKKLLCCTKECKTSMYLIYCHVVRMRVMVGRVGLGKTLAPDFTLYCTPRRANLRLRRKLARNSWILMDLLRKTNSFGMDRQIACIAFDSCEIKLCILTYKREIHWKRNQRIHIR
jgi:hypothetical protein